MKTYFLIGAYEKEGREEEAKCIDMMFEDDDKEAWDDLAPYVWEYHKDNLEKFDVLFLISENMKIVGRASSFTHVDFMREAVENDGNLTGYHPVYVDIAEHDERVLLSDILEIDLV